MINAAVLVMIVGCWLLVLPRRLRHWWTNEGGAVLIVTGLLMIVLTELAAQTP